MLANLWSRLLRRGHKSEDTDFTVAETQLLNTLDVGVSQSLTAMDCECLLTEEGNVVGATAEIDFENNQVRPTLGVLPKGFFFILREI